MIKYVFGILIGMLLIFGGRLYSDQEFQVVQTKVGTTSKTVSQCMPSVCTVSSTTCDRNFRDDRSIFHDDVSGSRLCDGILSGFSYSRNAPPSKLLKFSNIPSFIRIQNLFDVRLPENKFRNLSSGIGYAKYSCGYYVYALAHILI